LNAGGFQIGGSPAHHRSSLLFGGSIQRRGPGAPYLRQSGSDAPHHGPNGRGHGVARQRNSGPDVEGSGLRGRSSYGCAGLTCTAVLELRNRKPRRLRFPCILCLRHICSLGVRKPSIYALDEDLVFPSLRAKGTKPPAANMLLADYLRVAARKGGVVAPTRTFRFHTFRRMLASVLVKMKVDLKLAHEMSSTRI